MAPYAAVCPQSTTPQANGMHRTRTRTESRRPHRIIAVLVCALLAPLCAPSAQPALAQTVQQEALIQVLFGELPPREDLDANHDGALTVADILLLGPQPLPTPTPTATFTPTPSPTQTGILFAGTIAELVPHAVGDQLVYRVTDPLAKVTTETTNVISEDMQGGFLLDDKVTSGQRLESHQTQSYSDTGSQLFYNGFTDLFFTPHTSTTCTPPLLRLTTPLVAGQTFSTTVRCEVRFADSGVFVGFVDRSDTYTPIDIVESVTVPAGTFTSVVHISGTTNQSGQLETDEIYLAPGVGIVQQLQKFSGQTYRHDLISGTIGGHPVGQ
jgi:hypothetical protein